MSARAVSSLILLLVAQLVEVPQLWKTLLMVAAVLISGIGMLKYAFSLLLRRRFFEKDVLVSLVAVGLFFIGRPGEAVIVVVIAYIGETIEEYLVSRARHYIRSEIDVRPQTVSLVSGEGIEEVPSSNIIAGETILVRAGEIIGLDGIVAEGEAGVDTFPLTGETELRFAKPGRAVYAGCIPDGDLKICVTAPLSDSAVSRILDTIGWADNRGGKTEHLTATLSRYFAYAVLGVAFITGVLVPLIGALSFPFWLYRAFAVLFAAIPCALTISVPLTYLAALGGAAKKGILFKGADAIDLTSGVTSVVFDKTGTLTKGEYKVTSVNPNGITERELLTLAAYAEARAKHPVAAAILNYSKIDIDDSLIGDYREIRGKGGILKLAGDKLVVAGSAAFLDELGISHDNACEKKTGVFIALGRRCVGTICLSDDTKNDANNVVERLGDIGIDRIAMITGDKSEDTYETASILGITEVYSGLLPEEKKMRLVSLHDMQLDGDRLAFVGDGSDDTELLSLADVGIAIGRLKPDFSVKEADVLLISDAPTRVSDTITMARHAAAVKLQNILSAMTANVLILLFSLAFGAPIWLAILFESLVTLADDMNALRAYSPEKYDINILYDRTIKYVRRRRLESRKSRQRERIKKYREHE